MNRAAALAILTLLAVDPILGQDTRSVRLDDQVRITLESRIARDRPIGRVVALEPDTLTIREADDEERSFQRGQVKRIEVSRGRRALTSSGAVYGLVAAVPVAALLVSSAPIESNSALFFLGVIVLGGGAGLGHAILSGERELWVEATWPLEEARPQRLPQQEEPEL